MKKKLFDLLMSCGRCDKFDDYEYCGCAKCEYEFSDEKCENYLTEIMVNDLLNAGVLVPPVKIGDTVYTIRRGKIKEWTVYHISINAVHKFSFYITDKDCTESREILEEWIGDTVFLTEEDAITELKDRKGKNETVG